MAISAAEGGAILTDVFQPLLAVESSLHLIRRALDLERERHLAWYDALIVAAAQEAECPTLYSLDFQHGCRFGDVLVQDPFTKA